MAMEKFNEQLQQLPVDQILSDITATLAAISKIVNSPEIMQTIQALHNTLRTVEQLATNFNNNLQPLADNTNKTLESVDQLALRASRNIQPLADNTVQVLLDARQTLNEANALLTNMRQLLNEDSAQIYNLNIALDEIVNAARSVRNVAETIERQPETLLKGRKTRD